MDARDNENVEEEEEGSYVDSADHADFEEVDEERTAENGEESVQEEDRIDKFKTSNGRDEAVESQEAPLIKSKPKDKVK